MLPLSDGLHPRRFPIVNVSLIVANFAVWQANFGLSSASANGGGVAFFAHVGGFVFGAAVTGALLNAGKVVPQSTSEPALAPI